jgi:hypothetical protein
MVVLLAIITKSKQKYRQNPIPPHFILENTLRFIMTIILLSTLTLKEPHIIGSADNFIQANALVTPTACMDERRGAYRKTHV